MLKKKKALLASVMGLSIASLSATTYASGYQVQDNDTLWKISQSHGIPLSSLQAANPAVDAASLRPGQSIEIPAKGAGTYIVKQGDTFWKLSKTFNVPLENILNANPGVEPKNLQIGSSIKIPAGSSVNTAAPKGSSQTPTVTVKPKNESVTISDASAPKAAAPAPKKAAAPAPKAAAPVAAPKTAANQIKTASGQAVTFDRMISATATAYTTSPDGKGGFMGRDFMGNRVNAGTVAVDPSVIPLGSKLYITGYDFAGLPAGGMIARATDTGGAIKGNKIDLFVPVSQQQAIKFGVQNVKVYILK